MSTNDKPGKPDPVRAWRAVEKMIDDEEIDRIAAMSDEEVARELEAAGFDPAHMPSADELLAKAKSRVQNEAESTAPRREEPARSNVAPPVRPWKGSRVVWLLAAALGAALVAYALGRRDNVAPGFPQEHPDQVGPHDGPR